MKVHFNKIERTAGIFVLVAVLGFSISLLSVAIKQGWLNKKIEYTALFQTADGVRPGTVVQIAGLKAGSVDEVELTSENKIFVRFYVLEKFAEKVRQDSVASLIRPFVIGERVLDISPGSMGQQLAEKMQVKSMESTDLLTMMSGRQMGEYLSSMTEMMGNLRNLAEAFLSKQRTSSLVEIFDRLEPLVKNMNTMSLEVIKLSKQANKDERLGSALAEISKASRELNKMLPALANQAPQMAEDISTLVSNLAELTGEFKAVIPAINTIAPDLPRVSRRAVEALDEAVVTMKALQKSFLMRSNVEEVRDEERRSHRSPASK